MTRSLINVHRKATCLPGCGGQYLRGCDPSHVLSDTRLFFSSKTSNTQFFLTMIT